MNDGTLSNENIKRMGEHVARAIRLAASTRITTSLQSEVKFFDELTPDGRFLIQNAVDEMGMSVDDVREYHVVIHIFDNAGDGSYNLFPKSALVYDLEKPAVRKIITEMTQDIIDRWE